MLAAKEDVVAAAPDAVARDRREILVVVVVCHGVGAVAELHAGFQQPDGELVVLVTVVAEVLVEGTYAKKRRPADREIARVDVVEPDRAVSPGQLRKPAGEAGADEFR